MSSINGQFITPSGEICITSFNPEITYVKVIGNFPIYPFPEVQEACLIKWKEFLYNKILQFFLF